jgi:3-hydroxyisobutyrate dehydrogenase
MRTRGGVQATVEPVRLDGSCYFPGRDAHGLMRAAFLGLGNMGGGMAARLLAAGHALSVYNRTIARAAPLENLGAQVADSPRAAAQGADVVVGMTANDESSRSMWLGSEGGLAAMNAPGALVIECSTLSHDWVLELAGHARSRGARYLDAPVTGLPDAAAAGTLTLLIGAEVADLDDARPILTSFATRLLHFGAVGQGTIYKLMINLRGAVQIASAAEGFALAESAGLNRELVADAIASSQAASPQVVRNVRRFVAADYDKSVIFTPALRLKDIDYALRLARKLGVAQELGDVAERLYRRLCERGFERDNESRIIDVLRADPTT